MGQLRDLRMFGKAGDIISMKADLVDQRSARARRFIMCGSRRVIGWPEWRALSVKRTSSGMYRFEKDWNLMHNAPRYAPVARILALLGAVKPSHRPIKVIAGVTT